MQIIRKPPKPLIITLITILFVALLVAAAAGVIFLYAETVRFDHRDCSSVLAFTVYDESEGYSVNYPFFGNSLALSGSDGRSYALTFGRGGEKNLKVYGAVNSPIDAWVDYLATRYKKRVNLDYTLKQDSRSISVLLRGNAVDDSGENITLEQEFLFDIEKASPDNLPVWVNENETDGEFKEYWDYFNNTSAENMPEWLAEQLKA